MSDYHEPYEAQDDDTRDTHRALTSLKEEIEAVDWYHQRVVLQSDLLGAGLLVSTRGGDAEISLGADLAVGYEHHTTKEIHLFVTESFTFQVLDRTAMVPFRLAEGTG